MKQAVVESELSRYRISRESGLTVSQLSYFVNNQRSLTLPVAAKLAKVLGLELKAGKLIKQQYKYSKK